MSSVSCASMFDIEEAAKHESHQDPPETELTRVQHARILEYCVAVVATAS